MLLILLGCAFQDPCTGCDTEPAGWWRVPDLGGCVLLSGSEIAWENEDGGRQSWSLDAEPLGQVAPADCGGELPEGAAGGWAYLDAMGRYWEIWPVGMKDARCVGRRWETWQVYDGGTGQVYDVEPCE